MSSAAKTFSVTGWKVGRLCGPAPLVDAVRSVKQYLTFGTGRPLQVAVMQGLQEDMAWVADLRESLQRRRDLVLDGLRTAGITLYRASATETGVVAIPSVALYADKAAGRHLVRLAFCKNEHTLSIATARLAAYAEVVRV